MTTYHVPSAQFCCSGTKQLKVVIALYDNDILMRQVHCKLLSRSAEIVRNTVFPEIQSNIMIIDKLLRVVFDHDGIKFVNADYAINDEIVRRVGNLFYTRRFAELLLREVLIYNGKMKSVMQRIAIQVASQGCEIANLLPVNGKSWWPMVEDVFASPAVQALRYVLLAELETHTEYTSISIDATLRFCLSILGLSAKKDTASAYSAGDSVKRVLSVKGRTGAVLAMIPMSAETSEVVTKALSDNMSVIAKQQVKFVFCDNASPKLLTHLSTIFPVLETLALDPVHLPIVYEYSTWRKRTPGSIFLRTIMAKFNKRDNTRIASSWGPFYCGDSTDKLDKAESIMRQKILDRSMSSTRATTIQNALKGNQPWYTRIDYIESLAALVALYPSEVTRIAPGPNKQVYKILWSAAAIDRIEWMFNNMRIRHSMAASECTLLPSGTASNEALHAELNRCFRSTQSIHQSTIRLKLQILCFAKLVSHTGAMYRPTIKQMASSHVLARSLVGSVWTTESWREWRDELSAHRHMNKADLPLKSRRVQEIAKVKQHMLKRPASSSTGSAKASKLPGLLKKKRTAFTRQRKGKLLRQGQHVCK
ncbi:unnamed protein product [Polarella glacialis]|uniref:Uncharacterized protein n=1 Tax=Polarella glacialis TaxID=89957 RepID=A0A813GVB1_POLGL|nr:unnamed protein product [Polarella glacialis]